MHDRLSFSLERGGERTAGFTGSQNCQWKMPVPSAQWPVAGRTLDMGQSPGRRQSCCPKRFLMHSADFPQPAPLAISLSLNYSALSRPFPPASLGPFGNFVLLFCSFLLPVLLHFVNIKLWEKHGKKKKKRINELLKFPKWKQEHEHEYGHGQELGYKNR